MTACDTIAARAKQQADPRLAASGQQSSRYQLSIHHSCHMKGCRSHLRGSNHGAECGPCHASSDQFDLVEHHDPFRNIRAWMFLLAVFMAGMLCHACVPRLCQAGCRIGGKVARSLRACWQWRGRNEEKTRQRGPSRSEPVEPQSMGRLRMQGECPLAGQLIFVGPKRKASGTVGPEPQAREWAGTTMVPFWGQ